MTPFQNRSDAGKQLADKLLSYANRNDVLVLGLPRGGVPVAFEVAKTLGVPLDIFLVRKLGVPGHRELAMGAIASGGACVYNENVIHDLNISKDALNHVIAEETEELKRREDRYRAGRSFPSLQNKTVILIDDGLATGATMKAAVAAVKALHPAHLVVAVPVAPPDTCRELAALVDDVVCLHTPEPFWGVGGWYQDFAQTTDEEVCELLGTGRGDSCNRPV